MTNHTPPLQPGSNRLDRIEAILEGITTGLAETRAIADSNARAIQSLNQEISDGFAMLRTELRDEAADVVSMIGQNAQTIDRVETSLQTLINEGKADRAESQRQRQANEKEHAAFREQFQSLLLSFTQEIRQIRQQLSA